MTHHVQLICAGEPATAELVLDSWVCSRCGKAVRVVVPDRRAAYGAGLLAIVGVLALLPAWVTYIAVALATAIAMRATFRAVYRLRIPLLDREQA